MRRFHFFGWLLLVTPVAMSVNACGRSSGSNHAVRVAGGGGATTSGATSAGDATTPGGTGGQPGGQAGAFETGGGGAGGDADSGAGAGGAAASKPCSVPTSLAIFGSYSQPNGDELWLRDSGKAVTLALVPSGKPASDKPPSLWQVVEACPTESTLLLTSAAGTFARLDYVKGVGSLTACLSTRTAASVEQALALTPADRSNTIDAGCNGGPWTRFAKEAP